MNHMADKRTQREKRRNACRNSNGASRGPERRVIRRTLIFIAATVALAAGIAATVILLQGRVWNGNADRETRGPAPEIPGADVAATLSADPAVIRAVSDARQAVRQNPASAADWGRLGMTLAVNGYPDEAVRALVQAQQLDPAEPRWPYFLGSDLCHPAPSAAIEALREAAEREGRKGVQARSRLAETLLQENRHDQAAEEFRRILEQKPDDVRAQLGVARLAFARGDARAALDHLKPCYDDLHARRAARLLAAQAHQQLSDDAAARANVAEAEKIPPDRDWPDRLMAQADALRVGKLARLNEVAAFIYQNRIDEADAAATRIVKDYPDASPAWIFLGRARSQRGEYVRAEEALATAVRLAPESTDAHFYLGTALLLDKKPSAAADELRKTIALQPDFAEAHHNLANALVESGDRPGAIDEFRAALRCKPNLLEAHLDLGRQLVASGQSEAAAVEFRRAAELAPDDPRPKRALEDLAGRK